MTEDEQIPDSEDVIDDVGEQQEIQKPPARMVPLEALEAERTKRQDLESQNRALQEFMLKSKQPEPEEDDGDDDDFITKAEMTRRLQTATFSQKREILEEAFCQSRPDAVEMINQNLEQIIKTHP
jgi:chromatin segregation and condensation protein Rec8/ScpA/Scc1 (kleisin family)